MCTVCTHTHTHIVGTIFLFVSFWFWFFFFWFGCFQLLTKSCVLNLSQTMTIDIRLFICNKHNISLFCLVAIMPLCCCFCCCCCCYGQFLIRFCFADKSSFILSQKMYVHFVFSFRVYFYAINECHIKSVIDATLTYIQTSVDFLFSFSNISWFGSPIQFLLLHTHARTHFIYTNSFLNSRLTSLSFFFLLLCWFYFFQFRIA